MTIPYNAVAHTYARHRAVQSGVLRLLVDYGPGTGGRVLEVGCGTANHAGALRAETGCEAWGIDPSTGMLGQATRDGGLRLAAGPAEALPFADRRFDLVFTVDVVHHLRDLDGAFAVMARVLRPGGILITATDSEATIRARDVLSGYFPATVEHELARYPSAAQVEAAHRRAGLEIIETRVVEHPYTVTDARPFRERAYSCLHLISDEALAAGVARLERDLPLPTISRNYVLVAVRPPAL